MNLSMIRSGNSVFINAEYIKGYAFKLAVAGQESAHLSEYAMTAAGLSFASSGSAV
jgi:hypothetical protein